MGQRWRTGEIGCDGGTGRTGRALACIAMLAGIQADEAVGWVRDHYHGGLSKGPGEEDLVARFADWKEQRQT